LSSSRSVALDVRRLTVRHAGEEHPALLDVTERVEPGEVLAVAGPSGCGKSTLLRSFAGVIPSLVPAEVTGEVGVEGSRVGEADPAQVATRVGLVQQDPDAQICTLSVREEVAFGPENLGLPAGEVDQRVEDALARTGLSHLASRGTLTLSGGEKQRLAIASVLALRPGALLLDEPTAHLDPPGAQALFSLLADLREEEGLTLVVAEHRLVPLLPLRPRLLLFEGGRVVARRSPLRREDLCDLGLRDRWSVLRSPLLRREASALVLDRVSFRYGADLLFQPLSLSLSSGEILGVIGRNGSGKTTLLRLIAGLERPSEGGIVRRGKGRLGFLFQFPHQQIFERTVRREVEIEGRLDDKTLRARLAAARLTGLEERPPFSLSLGEERRLALSTALARAPDILLLDEPFVGQDRANAEWVIDQILAHRARGGAAVVVSHDVPLLAALCDRLLYLGDDPIVGDPGEVFAQLTKRRETAFLPSFWDGED
jgi:energy-coupling factor transport system ATP-binding protein